MITITEGMTPTAFLEAVNYSFLPAETPLTAVMDGVDFKTNYEANYDANKVTYSGLADKSVITVGMPASAFVAALNSNSTKINTQFAATYPTSEESYIIPNNRMSAVMGVWNYTLPAMFRMANGKTFFSGLSKGGAMSREVFGLTRNTDGSYNTPSLVGHDESTEGTYDLHGRGVFVEKGGIIYGVHEVLVGVSATWSGGHNSPMIIIKSTDGGDTWSEITRIGLYLSYPQLMLINGDFYLSARHQHSTESHIHLFKSTNNCVDWTQLSNPYESTPTTYWAYHRIPDGITDELFIIITGWSTSTGQWMFAGIIRSNDGVTWYNYVKSWSKDVTGGAITLAELTTNCLLAGNVNGHSIYYGGSFLRDSKLYTLIGYGEDQTADEDGNIRIALETLKIYEGTTILIDVSSLVVNHTLPGFWQAFMMCRDNNIFNIFHQDYNDSYKLKKHLIGTGGIIETTILKDGVSEEYGQPFAAIEYGRDRIDGRRVAVMKLTGDYFNDLSYADLIVFNNI